MNVTEVAPQSRNAQGIASNAFNLGSANSATFTLVGGYYVLDGLGVWNSSSITVDRLGPDGATYIATALTLSANGTIQGYLSAGTYKINVGSVTSCYASIVSVPI